MYDYSNPASISLSDLKERIKSTDLIPSRENLLTNIDDIFSILSAMGIRTWADLQKAIKNPKHIETFSKDSGINQQYLVLLRREVEGYTPKPFKLEEIDWVAEETVKNLIENGINNSEALLRVIKTEQLTSLSKRVGVSSEIINHLANVCGLTQVQWVSPTTARMLIEAGYETCQKLSSANADELYLKMDQVNENGKFFRGKIGLRDIKRLIEAAKYVE